MWRGVKSSAQGSHIVTRWSPLKVQPQVRDLVLIDRSPTRWFRGTPTMRQLNSACQARICLIAHPLPVSSGPPMKTVDPVSILRARLKGKTQVLLAKELGLSQVYLGDVLRGRSEPG